MPSKIKIEIRAEVRDVSGRLIKRYPWVRASSLLKQFIQLLMVQASTEAQTMKNVLDADSSVSSNYYNFRCAAAAAAINWGIVIGTGTTPVAMTDYKLQTQVTTNVAHGVVTFAVQNPDASTWRVSIARVFTNNTGASLGIKEVAIYGYAGGTPIIVCMDHTLYSVDVPNGVGVTLTYRITISL